MCPPSKKISCSLSLENLINQTGKILQSSTNDVTAIVRQIYNPKLLDNFLQYNLLQYQLYRSYKSIR